MNTYGDNGHIQQGWIMHNMKTYLNLTDLHQYIYQVYFQLVRSDDMYMLKINWKNLLNILFQKPVSFIEEIAIICKMILYTRDIGFGKGERKLSYMMLLELYQVNKLLGVMVFDYFVKKLPNKTSIGSWKDVKRFAEYIVSETGDENHDFINYMVELSNIYLRNDYTSIVNIYDLFKDKDTDKIEKYIKSNHELTLVAKWMPRKSKNNRKYAWLFNKLADNMHSHYFKTVYKDKGKVNCKLLKKAINKSEMNYRKMLSFVNKHLNVVEILQTSKQTGTIDFSTIPSKAREQYHKSFLNTGKNNDDFEKMKCKANYLSYLNSTKQLYTNCYLYEIVRRIVKGKLWSASTDDLDRQIVNKMWSFRKNSIVIHNMENIALVDMSCSMNDIPLFNAIALGIFIAEHNTGEFNNKLMMFGNKPLWVTFSDEMDICDKVGYIIKNKNNLNSDLYSVFNMLIKIIETKCLPKHKLKPLTLTILSDMQIEQNHNLKNYCMYSTINTMFDGARIHKPQLIFWNLKQTNGFPIYTIHNYSDVLMFSGYSEKVLYNFKGNVNKEKETIIKEKETINKKNNSDEDCHPKQPNMFLFNMLSNERYDFVNKEIVNILIN